MTKPLWRVQTKSFVGHALCEEGDNVTYVPTEDGLVGDNLWPLNDEAQAIIDDQGAIDKNTKGGDVFHPAKSKAKGGKPAPVPVADKAEPTLPGTDKPAKAIKGTTADGGRIIDTEDAEEGTNRTGEPDPAKAGKPSAGKAKNKAVSDQGTTAQGDDY